MTYTFRSIYQTDTSIITSWCYDPPYDLYNLDHPPSADDIAYYLDPQNAYHIITGEADTILAYCSFGPDGQVPGGDYSAPSLDIGMGVRPDLTGQGHGVTFARAVCDFARKTYAPPALRVTIADFNRRARRVWEKMGFEFEERFVAEGRKREFVILTRTITTDKDNSG